MSLRRSTSPVSRFFFVSAGPLAFAILGCGGGGSQKGTGGVSGLGGGSASGGAGAGTGGAAGAAATGGAGGEGSLLPCGGADLGSAADGASSAVGNAVVLDGTNWVTVPKTGNYTPMTGFTWEAWFNGTSLPTDTMPSNMDASMFGQILFTVADGQSCVDANLGFGGTFRAPAELAFVVDGPGGCANRDITPVHYLPAAGFQNGRWYHVAGVRDYTAGCVGLYLDGILVASKADTTLPIQSTGFSATIGRWTDGGYDKAHFKGAIDEVRIYGRPLSAAEIGRHYNGGMGRAGSASDPGLVAGWHLDEASGMTASDYGPSHLDGTYVNAAAHAAGTVAGP